MTTATRIRSATGVPSGCPAADKTFGDRRIDYILAKSSAGFSNARTITPTSPPYSDHKALTAYIKY